MAALIAPPASSPGVRAVMQGNKSKDTKPELLVRRLVHSMGFRYRLHRRDLPGKPDLAFIGKRRVIFVHGCFWHQHDCPDGRSPTSNTGYWGPKLSRNVQRDAEHQAALKEQGWESLTLWECETADPAALRKRVARFLR